MTNRGPADAPRAGAVLKPSSLMLLVALVDLLVIVPYSYWRFSGHRLELIIVCAVEGAAMLSLVGIGLYLRRRGT
jgi:hypothetical protein